MLKHWGKSQKYILFKENGIMKADDVASPELRAIAEQVQAEGLPEATPLDDKAESEELTQEQVTTALALLDLCEEEIRIHEKLGKPEASQEDDKWWQIRNTIRSKLQEVVLLGMLDIKEFQERLVNYGAFPDPEHNYKYYCMPNGRFACWSCGSVIMSKSVAHTVRDGLFPCSGVVKCDIRRYLFAPNATKNPPQPACPCLRSLPTMIQCCANSSMHQGKTPDETGSRKRARPLFK